MFLIFFSGIKLELTYVTGKHFFFNLMIHLISFQISNRHTLTKQVNTYYYYFLFNNSFNLFSGYRSGKTYVTSKHFYFILFFNNYFFYFFFTFFLFILRFIIYIFCSQRNVLFNEFIHVYDYIY